MAHKAWTENIKQNGKVVGYRVRYTDQAGVRHQEPGIFHRKQDAEALKEEVQSRIFNQRIGKVDPHIETAPLVNTYLSECRMGIANIRAKRSRSGTLKTYRLHLNYLIEKAPLLNLCTSDLFRALISDMENKGWSQWTICVTLRSIKTFMRWCKRRKYTHDSPFEEIGISSPDTPPRFFNDQEIYALDKAAIGDPFHLAYWLGLKCGLRRGEVTRADKRDIRWLPDGTGELYIWSDQSKNKHSRAVPLPISVMKLIGSRGEGLLYPGVTGWKFDYMWAKLKWKAGLKTVQPWLRKRFKWAKTAPIGQGNDKERFHDLRHTFCRLFLESDAGDIHRLSKITGHKSLDVLAKVYGHFQTHKLHEAVAIMENRPKFVGLPWENLTQIDVFNGHMLSHDDTHVGLTEEKKTIDK